MSEIEINYNLHSIMNIYDEFFLQTPKDIQDLFFDIWEYKPDIKIIEQFLTTHYSGDYLNKKYEIN